MGISIIGGGGSSGGGASSGIPGAIVSGHDWTWVDDDSLSLVPFGHISPSISAVLVDQATETTYTSITIDSTLTFDRTVSGAGGLDTGSPSNGNWYNVFLISKADGADPVLISSQTEADSVTMPTDYILVSPRPIWGWYQGGSRLTKFVCKDPGIGRSCRYSTDGSDSFSILLLGGTSTTRANVDLTNKVPSSARTIYIQPRPENSGATALTCTIWNSASQGGNMIQGFKQLGGAGAGDGACQFMQVCIEHTIRRGLDDCLAYQWTGAPTGGLTIFLMGFDLG